MQLKHDHFFHLIEFLVFQKITWNVVSVSKEINYLNLIENVGR